MRIRRTLLGAALGAALAISGAAAPAAAAQMERTAPTTVMATFNGQPLSLAVGWGDAQSCVVYSRTAVECFATNAEADAAIGYVAPGDPTVAVPACANGWLCLFDGTSGGGQRLIFQDDNWQNLNAYGFDNKTSSWRNNQGSDTAYLAGGTGGEGGRITLSAGGYASSMGSYNNWASSVNA